MDGIDYWGLVTNRYTSSAKSAYCAEIGSTEDDHNLNPLHYSHYMDAYMERTIDLRYLYVKFEFQHWRLQEEYGYDHTNLDVGTGGSAGGGGTWYNFATLTSDTNGWAVVTVDDSVIVYWYGSSTQVRFLFHSDDWVHEEGTYIDDFRIKYLE